MRIISVTFLNPAHYTLHLGGCGDVDIRGIRAFSREGWSDDFDIMNCKRVHIDQCYLRTSDDCIAVYGSRWDAYGGTCNVLAENCTLWADVVHPINVGTHGDYEHGCDILERLTYHNIDILEHHEPQPEYGGCMAICAGDGSTVQDVLFEDVRIEHISRGHLLDVCIRRNPDYIPVAGNAVRRVTFRNIR